MKNNYKKNKWTTEQMRFILWMVLNDLFQGQNRPETTEVSNLKLK